MAGLLIQRLWVLSFIFLFRILCGVLSVLLERFQLSKTAVAAPAPNPSPEEMLEAIAKMNWREFIAFKKKFEKYVEERSRFGHYDRYKDDP